MAFQSPELSQKDFMHMVEMRLKNSKKTAVLFGEIQVLFKKQLKNLLQQNTILRDRANDAISFMRDFLADEGKVEPPREIKIICDEIIEGIHAFLNFTHMKNR